MTETTRILLGLGLEMGFEWVFRGLCRVVTALWLAAAAPSICIINSTGDCCAVSNPL